jgi:Cu(I)/Ag(I) efflux system periplasmic protein CusF
MRKTTFVMSTVAALLFYAAQALAQDVMVRGEVIKLDQAQAKITIKHEAIKKFDMDAMSMVFKAANPAMLATVKVGDKIMFMPAKINGQFTVTKIEKVK